MASSSSCWEQKDSNITFVLRGQWEDPRLCCTVRVDILNTDDTLREMLGSTEEKSGSRPWFDKEFSFPKSMLSNSLKLQFTLEEKKNVSRRGQQKAETGERHQFARRIENMDKAVTGACKVPAPWTNKKTRKVIEDKETQIQVIRLLKTQDEEERWRAVDWKEHTAAVWPLCTDSEPPYTVYVLMGGKYKLVEEALKTMHLLESLPASATAPVKQSGDAVKEGRQAPLFDGGAQELGPFHGYLDVNKRRESFKEAAAREAEEESLGILGSCKTVLTLLSDPAFHFSLRANNPAYFGAKNSRDYVISLGELNADQRTSIENEFLKRRQNPSLKKEQKEVDLIRFIELESLVDALLRKSNMVGADILRDMLPKYFSDENVWAGLKERFLACKCGWQFPKSTTDATRVVPIFHIGSASSSSMRK